MTHDLAILGAGAAGTHVLAALARDRGTPIRDVVVLDAGTDLGPGLAYGEAADPRHTLGRVAWRRRDRGNRLRAEFTAAIATLRARGVAVEIVAGRPARALDRRGDAWCIATDGGAIEAARCVLATGHWHVDALAHVERAVDWRWDVRRLAAIGDDEDVLVLGASQSAIDLAIALAARSSWRGRIALASRTGLLPRVWGHLGPSKAPPGAAREVDRLRARDPVRLADILDAVRADLAAVGASFADFVTPGDGIAILRADLEAALASRSARREIAWQAVLWPTVPAVFDLFPRLPAEDRTAIAPHAYAALRHLEAIHTGNARRILALADAGRLSVHALGADITIAEDAHGVEACGVRGHRVIDARGHDPHIARSDQASLLAALPPARVPYVDRPGESLEVGGVWIDPATFRVRGQPNLYALGPLAMGQLPVYLGLWALRREATRIVRDLYSSGSNSDT